MTIGEVTTASARRSVTAVLFHPLTDGLILIVAADE